MERDENTYKHRESETQMHRERRKHTQTLKVRHIDIKTVAKTGKQTLRHTGTKRKSEREREREREREKGHTLRQTESSYVTSMLSSYVRHQVMANCGKSQYRFICVFKYFLLSLSLSLSLSLFLVKYIILKILAKKNLVLLNERVLH